MNAVIARDGAPLVTSVPDPEPAAGEVLVRVSATAVNRADLLQVAGNYPPPAGAPGTLGLELAGEVATGPRAGERVMALVAGGGYAEIAAAPETQLMRVPGNLSIHEAAAIPEAFLTAWSNMVEIAGLTEGEAVLVHAGASGVGLAATQIARAMGCRVFATASAGKHEVCREAGAEITIDYRTEDFGKVVSDAGGADVIVDFIGAPYWEQNLTAVRQWGRLVYVGLMGGRDVRVNLGAIMQKRLGVFGSTLRNRTPQEKARLVSAFSAWALPRFEAGELRPNVWRVMPLAEVAAAHEIVRRNENAGKIVLTTGAPE